MTDPWADMRDWRGWQTASDLRKDQLELLADADALLAVVRLLEIAEQDPGTVYFSATDVYDALAALPEHLKETK